MSQIPTFVAEKIAKKYGSRQIILLAWDGENTNIVTWGDTIEDCDQAASGGNMLKKKWGWPECNDQPPRVRELQEQITQLKAELAAATAKPGSSRLDCVSASGGKISFQERR
jgi:hypothetical protein